MDRRELGGYQILDEVGRGGMAVVYKAWQPSLERFVALKVLPEHFGHDPQFLARFHREAKIAARFSHPNIVYVFDVGEEHGIHYIAMEYLDGGSLRDRLVAGAFGLAETQGILEQLASALDYAHTRGLIHRDIKPGNILFTADGRPKVADFGIARPSGESRLTQTGILMGTPEYMAPEQAEGRQVDYRADLYALGVVLYQMLTGRVPFRRTTPHATLHAVIYEPPTPPRQVNPGLPHALEDVVLQALAKRPEDRFQRGVDMVAALRAALAGRRMPAAAKNVSSTPSSARQRRVLIWVMVAAALALVSLLGLLLALTAGGEPGGGAGPLATTSLVGAHPSSPTLPSTTAAPVLETTTAASSPALPAQTPVAPELAPATALPATAPLPLPTATSHPPTSLPPAAGPDPRFGRLAFSSNRHGNNEVYSVRLAGGKPKRLTNNSADDWLPDWAPDGQRISFTSNRTGSYDLWSIDASGNGLAQLVGTGAWDDYPCWAPDGRKLGFSTTAVTQGVPNSEIHARQANGNLVQLTRSTAEDQWPDWSPDGRIIYCEGWKGTSNWDILIMNGDGGGRAVWLGGTACDVQPTWSPDGKSIAFLRIERDTNGNGQVDELDAGDVWVGKANGGGLRRITSGIWATTPAWSPDSRWIAFAQLRDSNGNGRSDLGDAADIHAVPLAGGPSVPLVESPHRDGDPSWTD
jgi:serine/threonine protein kinase